MDELRNDEMQDEELEQYGVWVKAGPEEVMEAEDDFAFADLPSVSDEEPSDFSSAPSSEDIATPVDEFDDLSLDDLDFPDELDGSNEPDTFATAEPDLSGADQDDEADEIGAISEIDVAADLQDLDASRDELDLDEESLSIGGNEDRLTIDSPTDDSDGDLVSLDDLDIEVPDEEPDPFGSLDELEEEPSGDDLQEADSPEGLSDLDEIEDLADLESLEDIDVSDDEQASTDAAASDNDGGESFDLDDLAEELPDDYEEMDLDAADPLAEEADQVSGEDDTFDSSMPGSDDELQDISLDDINLGSGGEDLPELESELEPEESHDFTPEDQGIEIVPAGPNNRLTPDEEVFLDEQVDEDAPAAFTERQAFEEIQTELADIRKELAELKAALRGGNAAQVVAQSAAADSAEPPTEEDDEVPATGPGFFEDEEDETIALTGDELDNILNTAEFTEQAGEAEELDEEYIVEDPTTQPGPVDDIELEPVDESTEGDTAEAPSASTEAAVEFGGDAASVDELAEMDIDRELADIEALDDETTNPEPEEIEIDLDSLDEIEQVEEIDDEAEEQESPGAVTETDDVIETADDLDVDDLELGDLELEDQEKPEDFEQFAAAVEDDIAGVAIDESFDDELQEEQDDTSAPAEMDEEDEIEIDLDDIDGFEETEDTEPLEEPQAEQESDVVQPQEALAPATPASPPTVGGSSIADLPEDLKQEIRSVLSYMDQLLEALPDDKIEEFAQSEHFDVYKRLFEELGLET